MMRRIASQQQYAVMKNKPGVAAAASSSDMTKECEDESLLYLLDCLMMLYSAAVHRVLREVRDGASKIYLLLAVTI